MRNFGIFLVQATYNIMLTSNGKTYGRLKQKNKKFDKKTKNVYNKFVVKRRFYDFYG